MIFDASDHATEEMIVLNVSGPCQGQNIIKSPKTSPLPIWIKKKQLYQDFQILSHMFFYMIPTRVVLINEGRYTYQKG